MSLTYTSQSDRLHSHTPSRERLCMSRAFQAYVIVGATGERINSDRHVLSDTAANDPKWVRTQELMSEMFANFHKMDSISMTIDGAEKEFNPKFLLTAGLDIEDTDEEPTLSDQEALDGIVEKDIDYLLERLRA